MVLMMTMTIMVTIRLIMYLIQARPRALPVPTISCDPSNNQRVEMIIFIALLRKLSSES